MTRRDDIRTFAILAAVAAAVWLVTSPVLADQCGPRDDVLNHLAKHYDEHIAGRGLTPDGKGMVELTIAKDGTWTILVSRHDGPTCIFMSGDGWRTVEQVVLGEQS